MKTCWCGNGQLSAYSTEYEECRTCGTLVSMVGLSPDKLVVKDDESDFYGKQYWLDHQQQDLGFPNIFQRARYDLTERNLHWLRMLLKYQLPPATVLELGCSHGSFVALMKQAGYQSTGLEMSPWVAKFGAETFTVPILTGPIETQDLQPASLDVIAMMDVLEHFPDPLVTMKHCLELLKPDGVLIVQTPQYKENVDYNSLVYERHPFLQQLKSDEHLYIFSERSVSEFFKRLGAGNIAFEPAIFDCYDMFFAVSRSPLKTHSREEIEANLLSSPAGRIALALLDLRETSLTSVSKQAFETYQENCLSQIQTLTEWVHEARNEVEKLRAGQYFGLRSIIKRAWERINPK